MKVPKEILETLRPEDREAFRLVYAKKVHLSSTSFIFQWDFILFCLVSTALLLLFSARPELVEFFKVGPIEAALVLAFLSVFPLHFLSKDVRLRLNQKGIFFVHGLNILIGLAWVFFFALRIFKLI